MWSKLVRFKPGVPRHVHLLAAAMLWSIVGLVLVTKGIRWLLAADMVYLALPALVLGCIKSRLVLERSVEKNIERILHLQDGTCLGAVYSKATWLLVLLMIGMGVLLRNSTIPRPILGVVYIMIGWALIWASRKGWRAWLKGY